MYYSYAKLSEYDFGFLRFLGVGLGNLLFPWARFIVATRKYDLIPICPTWPQIKLATLIRKERDRRFYHNLFCNSGEQICGIKKIYLLSTLRKISEKDLFITGRKNADDKIVIFEGVENFFSDIIKDHNLVREELLKITLDRHKKGLNYNFENSISVHVRRGDVNIIRKNDVIIDRIPSSWYIWVINQIRKKVNVDMPIYIFSDGKNEELRELLSIPHAKRLSFGSSIADMLALSQANILIASISTFSMWASYLGRMPVIWYKGRFKRLYYDRPQAEIECAENEEILNSFFNSIIKK